MHHQFRRTTVFLCLFMGILAGLGLARTGPGYGVWSCWLLLLCVVVTWRSRGWLTLVLIMLFGVVLGWWRGGIYIQRLAEFAPLYDQKIVLQVRASEDAVYDSKTKQLTFAAGNIRYAGSKLIGKMQVSGFGENAVYQDDELLVYGKFRVGYGAQQAKMSFAQLQLVSRNPNILTETKRRFVAGAQSALPEPLGPFIMGLLVGLRDTLPESTKEDLRTVGLTHIIAVSGANLTIILQACQKLLGKRSKRMSTFLTLGLIGVFLLLSGASASIVRAAIVSMLSIFAAYYGRAFPPLNLILFAAVITAFANPIYIWSDLGWYLSFLAFSGILILSPLVQARVPGWFSKSILGGVALETICAEVMTLPFVLHIFGQMSRAGLVANILVVSFIPLAMLLGAIAGVAGMFFGAISGWITWPAVLVLTYMLDVAHILASREVVFVEGIGLTLMQMLYIYACIGGLMLLMWYKQPDKSAIITEMNPMQRRGLLA